MTLRPADLARLLLLAAIWGGSYAFMRIAAPVLGGIGTAWARILIAGMLLCLYAAIIGASLQWKTWWKHYLLIGMMNSAIPFSLIAFAMKSLPANYGAIINALSSVFGTLFAFFMLGEAASARKLAGIALGFGGVALLVRLGPIPVTGDVIVATLACTLATACYGFISVYTKKHTTGAPMLGLAAGALLIPGVLITPLALPGLPETMPDNTVILSVLALAIFCSGIAYLLYFRLIRDIGPTRAISVTFLIPVFGTLWGVLFLHETITLTTILGGLTIMAGMALVLGVGAGKR